MHGDGCIVIISDSQVARIGLLEVLSSSGLERTTTSVTDFLGGRDVNGNGHYIVVAAFTDRDHWPQLRRITTRAAQYRAGVVALLPQDNDESYIRAFAMGVYGVCSLTHSTGAIVATIHAAANGVTALPVGVAPQLAALNEREDYQQLTLSGEDNDCLSKLAAGVTIRRLARSFDCSERTMYRRLAEIYNKLGAHSRSQAVARYVAWRDGRPRPAPRLGADKGYSS